MVFFFSAHMTATSRVILINPYMTNRFSDYYHLGESTFILGASGVILILLLLFFIAPDGTPRYVGPYLRLYCLHNVPKKDARLI